MTSLLKKMLVIAPHPDDDVIGLGGLIAIRYTQNWVIDIVYVTNGAGSVTVGKYKNFTKQEMINLREKEAKKSIDTLLNNKTNNIKQIFMKFNSTDIMNDKESINYYKKQLNNILNLSNYNEIYLPNIKDRHNTHKKITELSINVLESSKKNSITECFYYETWDALEINKNTVKIDISNIYKQKLSAIAEHDSQCNIVPFHEGIIAKNRYNAVFSKINTLNNVDYVEIFNKKI